MTDFNILDFFSPIQTVRIENSSYENIDSYVRVIDRLAVVCNLSIYLIDYKMRNFIYVSPNPLFLCGYSQEEVKRLGYTFYKKVVPSEDLDRLIEINNAGFKFYYNLPIDKRSTYAIEYDFDLIHLNKSVKRVNHRLAPLFINERGDLWLAICIVLPSISERKENTVIIKNFNTNEKFYFSEINKTWYRENYERLTPREQQILQLSSQGLINEDIALRLKLNINTVKYHKRNIFQKLNVKNCVQAISVAQHWGML